MFPHSAFPNYPRVFKSKLEYVFIWQLHVIDRDWRKPGSSAIILVSYTFRKLWCHDVFVILIYFQLSSPFIWSIPTSLEKKDVQKNTGQIFEDI